MGLSIKEGEKNAHREGGLLYFEGKKAASYVSNLIFPEFNSPHSVRAIGVQTS